MSENMETAEQAEKTEQQVEKQEKLEKLEEIEAPSKPDKQEKVVVGNIYVGKVLKIKPFGAIVSLTGSTPGLVHISQIAAGYVQNVEDVLEVGDDVNVKVLSRDPASGKIALSMKEVPQSEYNEDDPESFGGRYIPPPPVITAQAAAAFEEKFKAWQKISNERIAGLNKRNKRR